MTPDVVTISPGASIQALQDLMNDKFIRHVPVVDEEGTMLGLVSDRDLLRQTMGVDLSLPISTRREVFAAVRVADIMTQDVESVDVDAPVGEAASIMLENEFGCVPVIEEGLLAGILTEADFVRHVADQQTVRES
jgi:CBS domain-containing membrane protein